MLDIATKDPKWAAWSGQALAECAEYAALVINPIIYAEVSIRFQTIEALSAALPNGLFERTPFPGRQVFWQASASSISADEAEREQRHCRISI
jgi:hypothetical protein